MFASRTSIAAAGVFVAPAELLEFSHQFFFINVSERLRT
jgi:hypothetical protein